MADNIATSHGVLNYSGMLFNKGNTRTPLSAIIGSKAKLTNHVEFTTGQEYEGGGEGEQPEISENASLNAPEATAATREQKTNVTQIFQETVGVSYGKMSNMGTLSGLNVENQKANPMTELDFQTAVKIQKIKVVTPLGEIYLYLGECLPKGNALMLDLDVIAPVLQPVPGKGNFFRELLSKVGAGEKYQLFGQIGLDHGPEWYHGKFTGIAQTFTAPEYSRKVYVAGGNITTTAATGG